MNRYHSIIERVVENEGGYVDDPYDTGGATKYGISLRFYRDSIDREAAESDIQTLTKEEAIDIYHIHWWNKYGYGYINDDELSYKIMDISINIGPSRAHKLAQKSYNNISEDKLSIDGILGAKSYAAINSKYSNIFLEAFRSECVEFYIGRCEDKHHKIKWLQGWINRLYDWRIPSYVQDSIDEKKRELS